MNYFASATPEQLLCLALGICGVVFVFWVKWQDEQQGGLEKSPAWTTFMATAIVFLAVQLQIISQLLISRMGA